MSETQLTFRKATRDDVPRIVEMLANDPLGTNREHFALPLPDSYYTAFVAIDGDQNQFLLVACLGTRVVGSLQITFIPSLAHQGRWRAQIEGVRVEASVRSQGIGNAMLKWATDRARERSCQFVQLTMDKSRLDAKRFYESLGFVATHHGFKLRLESTN